MEEVIGKRVKLLIQEKGFNSVKGFVDYLKTNNPQNYLSEDTIRNIIKGKSIQNHSLAILANALDVPINCLTLEYMPKLDGYLENEIGIMAEKNLDLKKNKTNKHNVKRLYEIDQIFYPNILGQLIEDGDYPILSWGEFMIYFPLIRIEYLLECSIRIWGEIWGYEDYVLNQWKWAYKTIPDCPAKTFADFQVKKSRIIYKKNLKTDENILRNKIIKYEKSEIGEQGWLQYREILEELKKIYSSEIITNFVDLKLQTIFKKYL